VPRPPGWQPGDPPPWTGANPDEVDVERIIAAVRAAPPPEPVRVVPDAFGDGDPAAVLVPIFDDDGEPTILFTRRSQDMRRHRGEVSFPGGRQDPGETLAETALREAWEEIALDPATVEIVGELNPIATVTAQTMIHPFVGVLPGRPLDLVPSPIEVELILTVPIRELLAPDTFREEIWDRPDRPVMRMPIFEIVGDTIWGATGHFLFQLLSLITADR
jgi:8-oxo-dGTP pyrophosphatase MutT (NUDIX family)